MQSQKITRSTARHLRRKRMNLARKAEKLSEPSEGNLIINENIEKNIKNTINLQIVESLDQNKDETKSPETSATITKLGKNSKKNKNSIKSSSNNEENNKKLYDKESSSTVKLAHNQLNVYDNNSQSRDNSKETILEELKKSEDQTSPEKSKESTEMLENQNLMEKKLIMSDSEDQKATKLQENIKPSENKEGKSKAQLRAERRAIQEAQRALKAQKKEQKESEKKPSTNNKVAGAKKEANAAQPAPPKVVEKAPASTVVASPDAISEKKVVKKVSEHFVKGVFNHLVRNETPVVIPLNSEMHPAIVKLGVKYAERKVTGSNCRCVALLLALKRFIKDFETSEQQDFVRGLEIGLNKAMDFLNGCRPISVTMQNALRRLRGQMSQVKSTESDVTVKKILRETIDTYIREQILLAGEAISLKMQNKIKDGDVILTYGHSSLVKKILCDAHKKKKFRVIVVDSRPRLEGKSMLKHLVKENIDCTYVLINAISFVMPQVSMVLLGAHSILANGAVMGRVGTAQVALMGNEYEVPVLVASEMNKSDDNALTDSFVYNELDNSDELMKTFNDTKKSPLVNWNSRKTLNLLNLGYDVTPASLITSVITELAIVPCSSLPVVLRVKPWEV